MKERKRKNVISSVLESRVRGLLLALGETSSDVVKTLKRRGIRGQPYHGPAIPKHVTAASPKYASEDCPIGNYLRASGISRPRVSTHFVWFRDQLHKKTVRVDNTAAVAVFVIMFDEGDYPELVGP